jgi:hypothetical protein
MWDNELHVRRRCKGNNSHVDCTMHDGLLNKRWQLQTNMAALVVVYVFCRHLSIDYNVEIVKGCPIEGGFAIAFFICIFT